MLSRDAKIYIGQTVEIEFQDRAKKTHRKVVEIYDVGYLPAFGPCLITDIGEIRLDRVIDCQVLNSSEVRAA